MKSWFKKQLHIFTDTSGLKVCAGVSSELCVSRWWFTSQSYVLILLDFLAFYSDAKTFKYVLEVSSQARIQTHLRGLKNCLSPSFHGDGKRWIHLHLSERLNYLSGSLTLNALCVGCLCNALSTTGERGTKMSVIFKQDKMSISSVKLWWELNASYVTPTFSNILKDHQQRCQGLSIYWIKVKGNVSVWISHAQRVVISAFSCEGFILFNTKQSEMNRPHLGVLKYFSSPPLIDSLQKCASGEEFFIICLLYQKHFPLHWHLWLHLIH